ncbi:ABC transporter permease [Thiococcus pfennigii]|uniref:ABC transporter permease n=1 Tax=Thiococcus pfennigii TaxID=1057 RepID=UPI0019061B54|nr:ABC transporter permease [Thiococcus pfennigii]MBK1730748.1 multidrug ABC transporter substrate-binding protein [Thiococcus pfennigii]
MLWNSFLLAFREIRRNVLRSFLTVLGIVIGVAAVIVMVFLGSGATIEVQRQIESLGSNLLIIRPGQRVGPAIISEARPFEVDDAVAIRDQIGGLVAVAPVSSQRMTAIVGNRNWATNVVGTENAYLTVRSWPLSAGREFSRTELSTGKAVCLVGATVQRELFGSSPPIGQRIRLNNIACQVIGLVEPKGQSSVGMDQDDIVIIPLRTIQRRVTGSQNISLIYATMRDSASTEEVKEAIATLLRERRRIAPWEQDDFMVTDLQEVSGLLTATTEILTALLGAVASVSLLVGGIGIMNIMLVSVTERTREIGIRLAIGAQEREVQTQFLVEAMVLSSLGGLIGIVLAIVSSLWLSQALKVPFVFDSGIVTLAFVFSAVVGVVFGYVPARRAAQLDPIEALRHE